MALNHGQILAVDDTPANLKVISETLRGAGYTVSTAIDGERALKRVQHYQPDLILLDIQMPGIDGFETCRRLKADHTTRHIPVIFITAITDTINKVRGLEIGGVDYITKPFEHAEFLARVKVHINLRRAQLQLIQDSKLSTLGELVAGIAHEVNNPINFITGNLNHAEQYHQDLIHLLTLYQAELPEPSQTIMDWQDQIDLDFLRKDYLKLLKSMKLGSKRITGVVSSLRSFARLDEANWKLSDLNESLDSTLMLLSHRLRANSCRDTIAINKSYGEVPPLYCSPTQVNQAFMHLLMNAIEAIDEKHWDYAQRAEFPDQISQRRELSNSETPIVPISTALPQIWLTTQLKYIDQDSWFEIQIKDNGVGISEVIQSQMFEQFFTTKKTGKGTGLGLAIAHQIISETHGGSIEFTSERGMSTTFTINLPSEPQRTQDRPTS